MCESAHIVFFVRVCLRRTTVYAVFVFVRGCALFLSYLSQHSFIHVHLSTVHVYVEGGASKHRDYHNNCGGSVAIRLCSLKHGLCSRTKLRVRYKNSVFGDARCLPGTRPFDLNQTLSRSSQSSGMPSSSFSIKAFAAFPRA